MGWDHIEKGWQNFKHSAVERWGKLTDEDLAEIDGRRDLLELESKRSTVAIMVRPTECECALR